MCTAGERHAAAAAACCCLFCVTPGFPLPCTVYFELTLGMGLISRTFHLRAFFTCFALPSTSAPWCSAMGCCTLALGNRLH